MKIEHWDKNKVYGYSDEIMLAGEPEDNRIPVEGNEDILNYEEIERMFPNQRILVKKIEGPTGFWKKAQVLWIHCSTKFNVNKLKEMGFPEDYIDWDTYSPVVGGLLN